MLSKYTLPSISIWKLPVSNAITPLIGNMTLQKNPIKEMIASNHDQNQRFQRFFSRENTFIPKPITHYDKKTAQEYEARCKRGDIEAIKIYGPDLLYGQKGLEKDVQSALNYLKYGWIKGDLKCLYHLGVFIFKLKNYSDAFQIFNETSVLGDGESEYYLYLCYSDGKGIEKDKKEALRYLKLSADKGYAQSCTIYDHKLLPDDPYRMLYLKKAADLHEELAEFEYGILLIKSSKSEDIAAGVNYIKNSADHGYSSAQYLYSKFLYEGKVTTKNLPLSEKYLKMAVDATDFVIAYACFDYANLLMKKKQPEELLYKYLKKAADYGDLKLVVTFCPAITNQKWKLKIDSNEVIQYLKKGIRMGSRELMCLYAKILEEKDDIQQADHFFRMAADIDKKGDSLHHYLHFLDKHKMTDKLHKYMKIGATNEDPLAMHNYAHILLSQDKKDEAIKYLKKAIDMGYTKSINSLALIILFSIPEEAFNLLKKGADLGNKHSMFNLALNISNGNLKCQNAEEEAFKYMKKAADSDLNMGIETLADWFLLGKNCTQNSDEAIKYYKKVADLCNNPKAQYIYGLLKLTGYYSLSIDYEDAFEYLKKSDENNYPLAPYALGAAYLKGYGIPKDNYFATQYFKRAADLGLPKGMGAYALMLQNLGDNKEAAKYLEKGAALENPECIYNLGLMYMAGVGVEKNREKGEKLLRMAARKGVKNALKDGEKAYKNGNVNFSINFSIDFSLPKI